MVAVQVDMRVGALCGVAIARDRVVPVVARCVSLHLQDVYVAAVQVGWCAVSGVRGVLCCDAPAVESRCESLCVHHMDMAIAQVDAC